MPPLPLSPFHPAFRDEFLHHGGLRPRTTDVEWEVDPHVVSLTKKPTEFTLASTNLASAPSIVASNSAKVRKTSAKRRLTKPELAETLVGPSDVVLSSSVPRRNNNVVHNASNVLGNIVLNGNSINNNPTCVNTTQQQQQPLQPLRLDVNSVLSGLDATNKIQTNISNLANNVNPTGNVAMNNCINNNIIRNNFLASVASSLMALKGEEVAHAYDAGVAPMSEALGTANGTAGLAAAGVAAAIAGISGVTPVVNPASKLALEKMTIASKVIPSSGGSLVTNGGNAFVSSSVVGVDGSGNKSVKSVGTAAPTLPPGVIMIPAAGASTGETSKISTVAASPVSTTRSLSTPVPPMDASTKDLGLTPMEVDQVLDSSLKDTELSTEEAALASSYLVEFASGCGEALEKTSTATTATTGTPANEGKSTPGIELTLDSDGMLGGGFC